MFTNIDIYILIFFLVSTTVGLMRGFSGEFGALIKILFTAFVTYKIIFIVNQKYDLPFLTNLILPASIYSTVYMLASFLFKFFINQLTYLIRTILPIPVDKFLGLLLSVGKAFAITIVAFVITKIIMQSLKIDPEEAFEGSYAAPYLNKYSESVMGLVAHIDIDDDDIIAPKILDLVGSNREEELYTDEDLENPGKKTKSKADTDMRFKALQNLNKVMKHYQNLEQAGESGDFESSILNGTGKDDEQTQNQLDKLIEKLEQ